MPRCAVVRRRESQHSRVTAGIGSILRLEQLRRDHVRRRARCRRRQRIFTVNDPCLQLPINTSSSGHQRGSAERRRSNASSSNCPSSSAESLRQAPHIRQPSCGIIMSPQQNAPSSRIAASRSHAVPLNRGPPPPPTKIHIQMAQLKAANVTSPRRSRFKARRTLAGVPRCLSMYDEVTIVQIVRPERGKVHAALPRDVDIADRSRWSRRNFALRSHAMT